jgi:hypothetical protein
MPLSQSDSRTTAVLVDEIDARGFKSAPNYVERRTARLAYPRFELMHRHYSDACSSRELLLVPFKESPRCPALCPRNHSSEHAKSISFLQIRRNFIDTA